MHCSDRGMEGSTPTIKLSRDPSQQHCLLLLVRLNTLKSCQGAWHWPLAQKGFENCVYPGIEETLFRLEITSSIWIEKYLRCVFRHHHGYYSCVRLVIIFSLLKSQFDRTVHFQQLQSLLVYFITQVIQSKMDI